MFVQELMTQTVESVSPDETLTAAMEKMRAADIGVLPVASEKRLDGIVTDRDIALAVAANGLDPKNTAVREIMSETVLYLYADTPAEEAARNLSQMQVRRMPVVDREKNLVGIIGLTDFAAAGAHELAGQSLKENAA